MSQPPNAAEEVLRLQELRKYLLLGTEPVQGLNDLCALAARICETPIAFITLVDDERLWFKSKYGFTELESSRVLSFCTHAVLRSELFIVRDATRDPRFLGNPLVTGEPGIRFYAGAPLLTPTGHALGTLGVMDRAPRDLTLLQQDTLRILSQQVMAKMNLRLQARELAESERFLRTVIDSEPECVKVLGPDGVLHMMNRAGLAMIQADGFEQVAGRCIYPFIAQEHRGPFQDLTERVFRGESGLLVFQLTGLKGRTRWLETHATPLLNEQGAVTGALGITRDITEQRQAEDRAKRLTRTYAVLSDINQTIVREKDTQRVFLNACRIAVDKGEFRMAWIGLLDPVTGQVEPAASAGVVDGYLELARINLRDNSRNQGPTGRALLSGTHEVSNDIAADPDYSPWREEALRRGYRSSGAFPIRANGSVVGAFNLYSGETGFFNQDELVLLDELAMDVGFALEVSQREAARLSAEDSLRQSEERFRELAENIQEVFWMTDAARERVLYVSPAYEKIWGRSCASLYEAPRTWIEAIHPEDRSLFQQADGTSRPVGAHDELYRVQRPDGTERWVHERAFPVRDSSGRVIHIVGTAQDVTTTRQLEEHLRQSQKLDAIGQLAGGVAHDFNNILGVILMQAELTLTTPDLPAEACEELRLIQTAANRGADLTRQLLLFGRRQVLRPKVIDVNEIVTSLARMLQRILGEDVTLQLNLSPRPCITRADPGMLDQVLMNLVVNARDAMPEGGRLVVETSEEIIDAGQAAANPQAAPGHYVGLRVTDTGCGIPPALMNRIFEPFFTTKQAGKGTGLGLATVFGIVSQHSGFITVQSRVGEGTTFEVHFPAEERAVEDSKREAPPPKPARGGETILLVEDETSFRRLTRDLLASSGYSVMEAPDGAAALRLWDENRKSIKLLVTDIVMPGGLSGRELARRLHAADPGLRVVFTSGYSADIAGRSIELQPGQEFLEKPFSGKQLLAAVRRCLDS